MTYNYDRLAKMVLMRSHNICFYRELRKIILELSFKERNVPTGDNPIEKGGKNENGTVASPESIPIHLKVLGSPPPLSAMFSKGSNFLDFLFAYLENFFFPNWG